MLRALVYSLMGYYLVKWYDKEEAYTIIPGNFFTLGSDLGVGCYAQATGYDNKRVQILKIADKYTGDRL